MSSGVCDNKTLTDLAHECGYSASYMKKIAKYAGISPKAYYNNLRVSYALKLLKEGKTINEVSEEMELKRKEMLSHMRSRFEI